MDIASLSEEQRDYIRKANGLERNYCTRTPAGAFVCEPGQRIRKDTTPGEPPMTRSYRLGESSETVLKMGSIPDADKQLIAKCGRAAETGELGALNRDHFAKALDALAKAWAEQSGKPQSQAYLEILDEPQAAALYRGYCAAPGVPAALTRKRFEPPRSQPEKRLDQLYRRA